MKQTIIPFFLMLFTSLSVYADDSASIRPVKLQCEYLVNPSGLDVKQPRLSWTLDATDVKGYGQKQTAYRILVSSTLKGLKRNSGDMWDSGWVISDNMQLIDYEGNALSSDRSYYWKVIVKDENGRETAHSEIATWSTGLFSPAEWTAGWIGSAALYDYAASRDFCNISDPWLRKTVLLDEKPSRATLFVASIGYHELYVNGKKIGDDLLSPAVTDHTKRARYIAYDIAGELKPGKNVIGLWLGTSWSVFAPYITPDKPRTPIVIAQADLYDKRGRKILRIETDETWKTHPSPNRLLGSWRCTITGVKYGMPISR